ncbi:MAG: nucleotidyltransferase domain-containing protein, partial [Clostridiales bacterium]|nr:nucleotidyltransferase domain-containing protein [Clostridiales bacterium]
MDERVRRSILEKNQKLIDMVIERVKRDFAGDIALIGLTGSFQTGDFHEASDLDLIIISENDRPAAMSRSFILGDVGYDIYLTPWSPRIEQAAALESPMVSALVDLQILYSAGPEATAKFEGYRRRALAALAQPIGPACLGRARTWIDRMMRDYAAACVGEDIGAVRYAAGGVLYNAVNALTQLNNTYIRRGIRRYR